MFKKTALVLSALALVLTLGLVNNARAEISDLKWYMTTNGSSVQKDTFTIGQTPYLYVHLDNTLSANDITTSWWAGNGNDQEIDFNLTPNSTGEYWLTVFDHGSDSIIDSSSAYAPPYNKIAGAEWTIQGYRTNDECNLHNTSFTFTPVPEPISASLFLLGGSGLALLRKRKNKKV